MKGISPISIGLVTIFIAIFMLFYIFDSLEKLANQCQAGAEIGICKQMNSLTLSLLIILLVIGGFVITICITVYIMLSA